MAKIPFFAIGSDELAGQEYVEAGQHVQCPNCGQHHPLEAGTNQQGQPDSILLFWSCREKSFLGAIQRRLLPGTYLWEGGQDA